MKIRNGFVSITLVIILFALFVALEQGGAWAAEETPYPDPYPECPTHTPYPTNLEIVEFQAHSEISLTEWLILGLGILVAAISGGLLVALTLNHPPTPPDK